MRWEVIHETLNSFGDVTPYSISLTIATINLKRAVVGLSKGKILTRRDEVREGIPSLSFAYFVPSC
jgi:hypothetical protein